MDGSALDQAGQPSGEITASPRRPVAGNAAGFRGRRPRFGRCVRWPGVSARFHRRADRPCRCGRAAAREHLASRRARSSLAGVQTLLSAAVYATLIVTFGFQVARVDGLSMAPTLEDHDRLIVNKLVYELGDPRPGDIVMLYYPLNPEKMFVKRVIAQGRRHGPDRRRPRLRERRAAARRLRARRSSAATTTGGRRSSSRATTS